MTSQRSTVPTTQSSRDLSPDLSEKVGLEFNWNEDDVQILPTSRTTLRPTPTTPMNIQFINNEEFRSSQRMLFWKLQSACQFEVDKSFSPQEESRADHSLVKLNTKEMFIYPSKKERVTPGQAKRMTQKLQQLLIILCQQKNEFETRKIGAPVSPVRLSHQNQRRYSAAEIRRHLMAELIKTLRTCMGFTQTQTFTQSLPAAQFLLSLNKGGELIFPLFDQDFSYEEAMRMEERVTLAAHQACREA